MCYKYPHNVIISQHSSKNGGGGVPLPISYNFNQSDFSSFVSKFGLLPVFQIFNFHLSVRLRTES